MNEILIVRTQWTRWPTIQKKRTLFARHDGFHPDDGCPILCPRIAAILDKMLKEMGYIMFNAHYELTVFEKRGAGARKLFTAIVGDSPIDAQDVLEILSARFESPDFSIEMKAVSTNYRMILER